MPVPGATSGEKAFCCSIGVRMTIAAAKPVP